ncbi:T9SS type B sorting domain-containing protein [Aquimarina sp. 2201CG5-10]|uniref:T9SS type B sorting domain-containing protein n=1 Tax=Aquimarina callyspongiae TaxID=3098150 RepID=UPI002AB356D5|nr:T9SS type B sorting domain-containing protein [Aquimarina sp. 2201CG5-10]MDY8134606.1 T9SS type B sorting domain-containing protein [Aquimarina sp. 2201CG5-10]
MRLFYAQVIAILIFSSSFAQEELCNQSQKPEDEPPITLQELSSLISTPGFYNADYRYLDDLGSRGGRYSAGFMDTWLGETQILFPYNNLPIRVNLTDTEIVANDSNFMYWMALAMGQEYMNVDMQWMIGFGAKETFSGTPFAGPPFNSNAEGAYGPFEVELFTGVDRAISYPPFYPEYETQLANAQDIATSGIVPLDFMNDYIGADPTELTEAPVVNAYMLSITNFFVIYNWYSYARDLCWHKIIEAPADKYYGLGAMAVTYNLGVFSADPIANTMLRDNYEATRDDPAARDLLPEGNNLYRRHITEVIEAVVNRAEEASTDTSIPLWDYQIDWSMIERFFLGEGGNVNQQGQGGLLKHFETADTATRQNVMNTLEAAFDILKGQAPSTTANTISFRYDWLVLLRTVKQHFSNEAIFLRPTAGDGNLRINAYSNVGGCCEETPEIEVDEACLNEPTVFRVVQNVDSILWEISDDSGTVIFTSANTEDMYSFTIAGVYTIQATVTIGGVVTVLSKDIIITEAPVANTVTDYILCVDGEGEAIFDLSSKTPEIIGNQTINDLIVSYHITQEDADENLNAIDPITTYIFEGDQQEIFARVFVQDNECYDTVSFMLIKNNVDPDVENQYAICTGIMGSEVVINPGVFDSYSWRNEDTGLIFSTVQEVTITETGNYSVSVTRELMGVICTVTEMFEIVPADAESFEVQAVFEGMDIVVTVEGNNGSLEYALDNIEGPYQSSPRFENVASGSHTVYVRTLNGCVFGIEVIANPNPSDELVIPKYFTPNGDSFHDTWAVLDPSNILGTDSRIFIFDRFGKLLKQLVPGGTGWNGIYNGRQMPSSEYWFKIEYIQNNGPKRISGHFSLIR